MAQHTIATMTTAGTLACDCGEPCAHVRAWHEHTAQTHNDPTPEAIAARRGSLHMALRVCPGIYSEPVPCTKTACHNAENGRECYTLPATYQSGTGRAGHPALYELTYEQAEALRQHGGIVSDVHLHSFC